jgi:hypothetical protein
MLRRVIPSVSKIAVIEERHTEWPIWILSSITKNILH